MKLNPTTTMTSVELIQKSGVIPWTMNVVARRSATKQMR
jgi:hypothetical protein